MAESAGQRGARRRTNRCFAHLWDLVKFGAVELPLMRWDQDEAGVWTPTLEPGSLLEELLVRKGGASSKSCWCGRGGGSLKDACAEGGCCVLPSPLYPLTPVLLPLAAVAQGGNSEGDAGKTAELFADFAKRIHAELPHIQEEALRRKLDALQAELMETVRGGWAALCRRRGMRT